MLAVTTTTLCGQHSAAVSVTIVVSVVRVDSVMVSKQDVVVSVVLSVVLSVDVSLVVSVVGSVVSVW